MKANLKNWLTTVLATTLLACSVGAWGQDFATFKGDSARTGKNAAPDTSGPGAANRQWHHPNAGDAIGTPFVVDNLDGAASFSAGWTIPPVDQEAADAYLPASATGLAAYQYAPGVSSTDSVPLPVGVQCSTPTLFDPRVDLATGAISTVVATYTFTPADGLPRPYALFAQVPHNPTGNSSVGFQALQRFLVYEIDYGNGLVFLDIVDTSLFGGGEWRQLGNQGFSTNQQFLYDGIHPIVIKVYNTVPRDSVGMLTTAGLVYADAFMADPIPGFTTATPIVYSWGASAGQTRTISATNVYNTTITNGQVNTAVEGSVNSYEYDTGILRWTWGASPSTPFQMDNQSAGVTADFPFTSDLTAANYKGVDYFSSPVTNTFASSGYVSYEPVIPDGSYWIDVWIAGDSNGENFAHNIQIEVDEGSAVTLLTLDESVGGGFVRIGGRKFIHSNATGEDLTVKITNYSADPADASRLAYADMVQFSNTQSGGSGGKPEIIATPAMATVNLKTSISGAPAPTPVVVVCGEDHRIHCLDANGNADGTTNEYWSYPTTLPSVVPTWDAVTTYDVGETVQGSDGVDYRSLQASNTGNDPSGASNPTWWGPADPNQVTGLDLGATMPSGFGVSDDTQFFSSSPLIVNVGGKDLCYCASTNGRIYCIDMEGRGDMNVAKKIPGTTTRVWSFPDDFPSTAVTSTLGPFKTSLAYAVNASGPTIYAGTNDGHMYALDAAGDSVNKITTVKAQYPAVGQPNLNPITATPAVDFGKVFFGTSMSADGTKPGVFYALNMDDLSLVWSQSSTTDPLIGGSTVNFDNFKGGPCTVSGTELGGGMSDTVYASNDNRYIMAFDAATGTIVWQTNELNSTVNGALTYSPMTVPDPSNLPTVYPVVIVPTTSGFTGLLCRTGDLNRKGTRTDYIWNFGYGASARASVAVGLNWLYSADTRGTIEAFNNGPGSDSGGGGGGTPGIVPNDPLADTFAGAKVKLVTENAYNMARNNTLTYAMVSTGGPGIDSSYSDFEMGETVYVMTWNFPYVTTDTSGHTIAPPRINPTVSADGYSFTPASTASQLFPDKTAADPDGGFVIQPIALDPVGLSCPPPGHVKVSVTLSSQALNGSLIDQTFSLTPGVGTDQVLFTVANPLALVMHPDPSVPVLSVDPLQQIGAITPSNSLAPPDDGQNLINGSQVVRGYEDKLISSAGAVAHGQNGSVSVGVIDRSLDLLRNAGIHGLNQVRVSRQDLTWNRATFSGPAPVGKPLPSFLTTDPSANFPGGFQSEDYPVNYPNDSLDYPDIKRSTIKVTKDLLGNAENPLFNGVTLDMPTITGADPRTDRTLNETPFTFEVDVPKYQPWNTGEIVDSSGNNVDAGYQGSMVVFVDRGGTGVFDITGTQRPSFRTFTLANAVTKDERLSVATPIVDLGSLPVGSGYSPSAPGTVNSTFSPFTGPYSTIFKPFVVRNEGNVNLTNLRIVHATTTDGTTADPWPVFAPANDILGWLDSTWNVWSDMDDLFYSTAIGQHQVALQKARVGDRGPTELSVNPIRRANPSHGAPTGGAGYPLITPSASVPQPGPPHIAATIPFGFPSGTYSSLIRVFEDDYSTPNNLFDLDPSNVPLESYSDPSFTLKFTVRESQLTNTYTPLTSPMVDDLVPAGTPPPFKYQNVQPTGTRDLFGNVVLAWASDRMDETTKTPEWAPALPTGAVLDPRLRLYVASVAGNTPGALAGGTSPLNDLNAFTPDPTNTPSTRWFQQEVGPYPTGPLEPMFDAASGQTVIPETAQFHYPSLPAMGFVDPLDPTSNFSSNGITMAFVGDAQVSTSNGRIPESRLFATTLTTASGGAVAVGPPVAMTSDVYSSKGRPSVAQFDTQALIFYPASGTSGGGINWVTFNGSAFGTPTPVDLASGFESVSAVSVAPRKYKGVDSAVGPDVVDMAITAKLRGRANSEVFFGRMNLDASHTPTGPATLPVRTAEVLTRETESGVYRTLGVDWNPNQAIDLEYTLAGVSTPLLSPGSFSVDPSTDMITAQTALGRVYLDPNLGTVRFATAPPNPNAVLTLTYQPMFIRVSEGTASGYVMPSLLFDDRYTSDIGFWVSADGSTGGTTSDPLRNARYIFTYGRAAAGTGQGARPFMSTMRLGLQLPTAIATNPDGTINAGAVVVHGNVSFYQIDPAQGKIYFMAEDEDSQVYVDYVGVDSAGNALPSQRFPATGTAGVGLVSEREEGPMPIEQAVNESNVFTFMDPFDGVGGTPGPGQRPNLFWVLWSSTRGGGSDLFFQTLAPRFTPLVGAK